jgi:hypothetical protein
VTFSCLMFLDHAQWHMTFSCLMFLDHAQWHITVGRTPLDEW